MHVCYILKEQRLKLIVVIVTSILKIQLFEPPGYVCLHEYGDGKSNSKMGSHALALSHDIYISPGSSGWPVPENHGVTACLAYLQKFNNGMCDENSTNNQVDEDTRVISTLFCLSPEFGEEP